MTSKRQARLGTAATTQAQRPLRKSRLPESARETRRNAPHGGGERPARAPHARRHGPVTVATPRHASTRQPSGARQSHLPERHRTTQHNAAGGTALLVAARSTPLSRASTQLSRALTTLSRQPHDSFPGTQGTAGVADAFPVYRAECFSEGCHLIHTQRWHTQTSKPDPQPSPPSLSLSHHRPVFSQSPVETLPSYPH